MQQGDTPTKVARPTAGHTLSALLAVSSSSTATMSGSPFAAAAPSSWRVAPEHMTKCGCQYVCCMCSLKMSCTHVCAWYIAAQQLERGS